MAAPVLPSGSKARRSDRPKLEVTSSGGPRRAGARTERPFQYSRRGPAESNQQRQAGEDKMPSRGNISFPSAFVAPSLPAPRVWRPHGASPDDDRPKWMKETSACWTKSQHSCGRLQTARRLSTPLDCDLPHADHFLTCLSRKSRISEATSPPFVSRAKWPASRR
jgi:hypothetical protein